MSIEGSHSGGNEKNREPKRLPMGCSGSQRGLKEQKKRTFRWRRSRLLAENPFRWRRSRLLGETPFRWRRPRPLAETPFRWRRSRLLAENPFRWRRPRPLAETPFRWRRPRPLVSRTLFSLRSVRVTGVGSTAQINAQACNSENRCDSLQITFLLKDNYAKIKYQNIKDGHKTNEQLFYIRSAYHRTAA